MNSDGIALNSIVRADHILATSSICRRSEDQNVLASDLSPSYTTKQLVSLARVHRANNHFESPARRSDRKIVTRPTRSYTPILHWIVRICHVVLVLAQQLVCRG